MRSDQEASNGAAVNSVKLRRAEIRPEVRVQLVGHFRRKNKDRVSGLSENTPSILGTRICVEMPAKLGIHATADRTRAERELPKDVKAEKPVSPNF